MIKMGELLALGFCFINNGYEYVVCGDNGYFNCSRRKIGGKNVRFCGNINLRNDLNKSVDEIIGILIEKIKKEEWEAKK